MTEGLKEGLKEGRKEDAVAALEKGHEGRTQRKDMKERYDGRA